LGYLDVNGIVIIIKRILIGCESVAEVRVQWQILASMDINLRVPYNAGNFLTTFSRTVLLYAVSSKTDGNNFNLNLLMEESKLFQN